MADNVQRKIKKYSRSNTKTSRRKKLVMSLAAVVVFCTTYALILPALTMSGKTSCGLEEHVHTEECYTEGPVLVCKTPEEGHTHTDDCWAEEEVLVCGLEEDENHTHTEECYELQQVLVCGMEECDHHEHTEECWGTGPVLSCGLEEHTHTLQCWSDPTADVENEEIWAKMFTGITLTGNAGEDVITVAKTQIGYAESKNNYIVAEDGITTYGYTRYGDKVGMPYSSWDALFCSFCIDYAGVSREDFPTANRANAWVSALAGRGMFAGANEEYTPLPGDLIFFDLADENGIRDGAADRVGFVLECSDGFIKTVEGDLNDAVACETYVSFDANILGYGKLPVNEEAEEELPEAEAAAELEIRTITAEAEDGAVVTITGRLPEGAEAVITPIELTEEQYAQLVEHYGEEQAAAIAENYAAYDICIMVDGVEWEPDESVSVVVSRPAVESEGELAVAHVENDNTVSDVESTVTEEGDVSFETGGFSVYIFYPVEEGEDEEGKYLQAVAEDGLTITIRAEEGVFPFPVEELSVSIEDIEGTPEEIALLEANGVDVQASRLVDISIWHGEEKVEPDGVVTVTISNYLVIGNEVTEVAHITEDGQVELLEVSEDEGGVSFDTESFSTYAFTVDSASNNTTFYLYKGDKLDLTGTKGYRHSWTSSRTGVATVSGTNINSGSSKDTVGTVNPVAAGTTTITHDYRTSSNTSSSTNKKSETITVVVVDNDYVVEVGDTITLPGATGGSSNQWSSDKTSKATVSGGTVTGVAEGESRIKHTYKKSGTTYTEYFTVKVIPVTTPVDPVTPDDPVDPQDGQNMFEHHKRIDYLGDGGHDSDAYTDVSGHDLYRLYLDMTGDTVPVDLLLVVDVSKSMYEDNDTGESNSSKKTNSRISHVERFLNGSNGSQGFIDFFLNLNDENKISIVTFRGNTSSNTAVKQNWTGDTFTASFSCEGGTNYVDALSAAGNQLASSAVANDGHKKIMIFLSDGAPTTYTDSSGEHIAYTTSGGIQIPNTTNKNATQAAINSFKNSHRDITIYTVGYIGNSGNSTVRAAVREMLVFLATREDEYFAATDAGALTEYMHGIFKPYNVTIEDKLSANVEYYSADPDVVVTMKSKVDSNAPEKILYQNGAITADGQGIIDSITYTPSTSGSSTGTVSLKFVEGVDNSLKKNWLYTLSFNVKATDNAKEKGTAYTEAGNESTDWGGNGTSSLEDGFYSNQSATVTYDVDNLTYYEVYQMPVIQVDPKVTVRKDVASDDHEGEFPFSITYTDVNGEEHTEEFTLTHYDPEAENPSEKSWLVLAGTDVTVTELSYSGFTVKYTVNDEETVKADNCEIEEVILNKTIVFTNTPGAELPKTGGEGTGHIYAAGAVLLVLAAGGMIIVRRRKEDEAA